ncbi:glycosyltransferase family 2 protein [Salinicola sp. DM10]|uniref:glycosyltransferase family 2 protein n=1 Tax=Salinicola sp. DM10 TaxID=2815721 RepID=UPI001A8C4569|nr:glycosyltransferase family 2 protein [Salinicola sp. DM10]MCE3026003.1 glycosyltransferase family 2 protein [Salinicola sp. DM10]
MKPNRGLALRARRWRLAYPRFRVSPSLMPMGEMHPVAESEPSGFTWHAADKEAHFILLGDKPTAGWNMIELGVSHDRRAAAACLTFDMGRGFERRHSIFLVVRSGKVSKRVCFVPYGARRIRLEPLVGQEGQFRVDHFNIVWLTARFAYTRMINRIGYADKRFQGVSEKTIVRSLKREGREEGINWKRILSAYYEATFTHCAPETSYEYWQEHIEILREPSANKVARVQSQFAERPQFAIVLTQGEMLSAPEAARETLNSVLGQRFADWRLYVPVPMDTGMDGTIDAEPVTESAPRLDTALADWFGEKARDDTRILRVEGDLAAALAQALEDPANDYMLFLRCGDRLAPSALFHFANHRQVHADAAVIYGDDDSLDANGERTAPNFKPQWNPDLLLSTNYIGHAVAFGANVLRALDAPTVDGPLLDMHRLLLAVSRSVPAASIHHVPFVVHHKTPETPAVSARRAERSCQAVADHLQRLDSHATVEIAGDDIVRIGWAVPEPEPLVSLLIPTRDRVEILKPCVDTLLAITRYPNYEVIILDNESSCPETLAYMEAIQADTRVRVLRWNEPFNYSAINNFGARHARGSIIGLVNNDIEPINPEWLTEMVAHACRPEIGCVGAKLYYPDGTVQHGGVILGLGGVAGHAHRFFPRAHPGYQNRLNLVQNLSAVTAACLLLRREVFDAVQGLNETELTVAYNDVDLCLKVREQGYRNLWTPFAELYHHESISRGADDNPVKQARAKREVDYMRQRWREALQQDPAYNPNLTLSYEDFSLR